MEKETTVANYKKRYWTANVYTSDTDTYIYNRNIFSLAPTIPFPLQIDEIKSSDMDGNVLKSNSCTQQLPNELLLYMTKYWSDEDCVALALSGVVKGFASFFRLNR